MLTYADTNYIEFYLTRLASRGLWVFDAEIEQVQQDRVIAESLADQISRNLYLTEKQRTVAVRLVNKYKESLAVALTIDLTDLEKLIAKPEFKFPVRVLSSDKTITFVGDETRCIHLKFPFDNELAISISKFTKSLPSFMKHLIYWDSENRAWRFPVTEDVVAFLAPLVSCGFAAPDEFIEYAEQVSEIQNHMEDYIPMVVYTDNGFEYKNVVRSIPQPTSTDLIDVLFDARRYGITCWDTSIDDALNNNGGMFSESIVKLLKNTEHSITLGNIDLNEISPLILQPGKTLVIIPGGSELQHLTKLFNYFKSIGISESEMSAMFRLSSSSGLTCNEFIKSNAINNPITDQTKIAFVSGKLPKPLIENNVQFETILYFGANSAHYTLKSYVQCHHNVVNLTIKD